MIFSIIAAVFFAICVSYHIHQYFIGRSYYSMRYKGETYRRNSRIVPAKVESLQWAPEGHFILHCVVGEDGTKVHFPLRETELSAAEGTEVFLVEIEAKEEKAYMRSGVSYFPNFSNKEQKDFKSEPVMERGYFKAVIFIQGALLAAALMLMLSAPLFSILACVADIYISYRNIPFKNWTKDKCACIIRTGEKQPKKVDAKDNGVKTSPPTESQSAVEKMLREMERQFEISAEHPSTKKSESNLRESETELFVGEKTNAGVDDLAQQETMADDAQEAEKTVDEASAIQKKRSKKKKKNHRSPAQDTKKQNTEIGELFEMIE